MDAHAAAPSIYISINMDVHAAAPSLLISIKMDVHAAAPSLLISINMASPSDVSQYVVCSLCNNFIIPAKFIQILPHPLCYGTLLNFFDALLQK